MHEDLEQLDDELAQLGSTLRAGNLMGACLQLAEFALKLDRYIRQVQHVAARYRAFLCETARDRCGMAAGAAQNPAA